MEGGSRLEGKLRKETKEVERGVLDTWNPGARARGAPGFWEQARSWPPYGPPLWWGGLCLHGAWVEEPATGTPGHLCSLWLEFGYSFSWPAQMWQEGLQGRHVRPINTFTWWPTALGEGRATSADRAASPVLLSREHTLHEEELEPSLLSSEPQFNSRRIIDLWISEHEYPFSAPPWPSSLYVHTAHVRELIFEIFLDSFWRAVLLKGRPLLLGMTSLLCPRPQSSTELLHLDSSQLPWYGLNDFPSQNSYVGALTPNVTICKNKDYKEVSKVKWGLRAGPWSSRLVSL